MRLFIVCVLLLYPQNHSAHLDELILSDGTVLIGTVIAWDRERVVIRTQDDRQHHVLAKNIRRMSLTTSSIQAVSAKLPAPARTPASRGDDRRPEKAWKGTLDFSYAGNRGTSDSDSLVLDFKGERKTKLYRLQLSARYFYAVKNSELAGNQVLTSGRLDRFFSARSFVFGSVDFTFDEVEKIDSRITYAGGFGYQFVSTEDRQLSINGGGGYTLERFSDGTRRDTASAVFNQEYQQRLFARSRFEQQFYYLQDLQNIPRFKFRLNLGLRTRLNSFLSMRLGIVDSFDHRPQKNVKRNNVSFTTGLGVTF
ncbi:MAG: DUF481 domain-containing protein [Acidobacteria bacterium]|nr:MAG: DUF481 domain-containing protein [Acidobacteriota bacterium]